MITKRILDWVIVGLCFHGILHSNAQYQERPSGIAGMVQNTISMAEDLIENSFETAAESIDFMNRLLKNTLYSLANNPVTELTPGMRNRNVGTSMIMLRNTYVESMELVAETIHQRTERMKELREQIQRAESILDVPIREIQYALRCLNSQMATDITSELFLCSTPPIQAIMTEQRQTQEDVAKVLERFTHFMQSRQGCLNRPVRDSVQCFQSLINETPAFLETLHEAFGIPQSIYEIMQSVNECSTRLRNQIKSLCPTYF